MLENRTKLILIIGLLLGIPLSVGLFAWRFIGIVRILGDNQEQLPVRSLTLTLDPSQRKELFLQLQKFADKHGFEYMISDLGTGGENFIVELLGNNIKILIHDKPEASMLIAIDFYDDTRANPVSKETLESMDSLLTDLESFLRKIPNVIINERLKRLSIRMNKNQRAEVFTKLFAELQELAKQHSLEFEASSYNLETRKFLVKIGGDGFQITSQVLPSPLTEMNVDFYVHYDDNGVPTSRSQKIVDELFNDIDKVLGGIPNVTIVEE